MIVTIAVSFSEIIGIAVGMASLGSILLAATMWLLKPHLEKTIGKVVDDSIVKTVNGKIDNLTQQVETRGKEIAEWQQGIERRLGMGTEKMETHAERIADVERQATLLQGEMRGLEKAFTK